MTRLCGPTAAFVTLFLAASASAPAAANELEINSAYVFERLGSTESKKPVASGSVDFGHGIVTGNVWGQWGSDRISREVDLTANIAHGDTFAYASVYIAAGSAPIYTVGGGVERTLGPITLELEAQRYDGAFTDTVVSVAGRRTFVLGSFTPTVAVGKAFNWGDVDVHPWYARFEVPLGSSKHAPVLMARGYTHRDETGGTVGMRIPF